MSVPAQLNPRRWEEVLRWLARAEDDLVLVDMILNQSAASLFGASLHCQQAGEKIAKAVLIAFGVRPPRTHDLDELGERVLTVHPDIGNELRGLGQLTTWYIASRYPDVATESLPSVEDIRLALKKLRDLLRRVQSLVPKR
jgi:HEPN domain-containing protein